MAEVVLDSTQHLSDADLAAMAAYLQALPPAADDGRPAPARRADAAARAARASTPTTASRATASGARASPAPIRRWPATAR